MFTGSTVNPNSSKICRLMAAWKPSPRCTVPPPHSQCLGKSCRVAVHRATSTCQRPSVLRTHTPATWTSRRAAPSSRGGKDPSCTRSAFRTGLRCGIFTVIISVGRRSRSGIAPGEVCGMAAASGAPRPEESHQTEVRHWRQGDPQALSCVFFFCEGSLDSLLVLPDRRPGLYPCAGEVCEPPKRKSTASTPTTAARQHTTTGLARSCGCCLAPCFQEGCAEGFDRLVRCPILSIQIGRA